MFTKKIMNEMQLRSCENIVKLAYSKYLRTSMSGFCVACEA